MTTDKSKQTRAETFRKAMLKGAKSVMSEDNTYKGEREISGRRKANSYKIPA